MIQVVAWCHVCRRNSAAVASAFRNIGSPLCKACVREHVWTGISDKKDGGSRQAHIIEFPSIWIWHTCKLLMGMCCLTVFQVPYNKHQQMAFASKSRVAVTAVERKLRGPCSLLLPKWHGIFIQLYNGHSSSESSSPIPRNPLSPFHPSVAHQLACLR